ncbi:hypothetical protein [Nevskia sp.]|uniref:LpxL/LpxP family acyltransferase n=1 Tax=Nevskia sp. TaxID=1929292 RepID=UPI0025FA3C98|nr:hypothetical protein [Nevskia sp.]
MSADGAGWEAQRERSSAFWVGLLVWVLRRLGRAPARLLLWPTVAWFLIAAGSARRASRAYLRRVLDREPTLADVARHFFTFAACSLDRLLLTGDQGRQLTLNIHRSDAVLALFERREPALVLVSHFGSFEALRVIGSELHEMPLKILLDRQHGAIVTRLIEGLDPGFAASIIDASERGPTLVLALRDAIRAGYSLGVMADRVRGDEPSVCVRFLGAQASLPTSPWVLASALKLPVIAAFGIHRGGRVYDARFELLETAVDLPRADRDAALQACAQRYAALLEQQARAAPYNWFNFYDYWLTDRAAD